jgi:hypothetical protein
VSFTTPSHERAVPPVSASSIQIDKFPYKFCLCRPTRNSPFMRPPCGVCSRLDPSDSPKISATKLGRSVKANETHSTLSLLPPFEFPSSEWLSMRKLDYLKHLCVTSNQYLFPSVGRKSQNLSRRRYNRFDLAL